MLDLRLPHEKPRAPIRRPNWGLYTRKHLNDTRCVVYFDRELAEEELHTDYGEGRRLLVFASDKSSGKFLAASAAIIDHEQALLESLEKAGVDCILAGKLSYHGISEFIFQVEDEAEFDLAVRRWMETIPQRCDLLATTGWTFFDEFVRPAHEQTLSLVPQELEHSFFGQDDLLRSLAIEAHQQGFVTKSSARCALVLSRTELLFDDDATEVADGLKRMAQRYGVAYRGTINRSVAVNTAN